MAKRDPQRTQKLRIAVRYLLERDCMAKGNQSRLAEHFKVSRQRVHQIVVEERQRLGFAPVSGQARPEGLHNDALPHPAVPMNMN
ncbi:MAG TPA: hypothetical protein VNM91_06505 [Dehalococcoidia bacterium]|nr:hypothetical protein [Dehalococcoidia bacterium]